MGLTILHYMAKSWNQAFTMTVSMYLKKIIHIAVMGQNHPNQGRSTQLDPGILVLGQILLISIYL